MHVVGGMRFNEVMGSSAERWPLATGQEVRADLTRAYGDPSRGHHDLRHLAEVLARVEELERSGAVFDRLPVLLAAWFHDAVYDGERDAEERSATWAEAALPGLTDDATVAETARLVRLTETHRPEDDDANGCVLSDADLGVLASPPERYAEYVSAVREEYAHLPDEVFAKGRRDVLGDLLAKPRLFHTAHGRDHWEAAARANVEHELAGLAGA